ncbi:unnamed protein product [Menidia menidia]|uniref:(Atlantic silverside) hypothetical protein n=1 Tax=Menidia menidia TaxID=238744 RepID=A0A8S4AT57_9TELE|nr:unnamed protein product [Menidia menidia]
MTCKLGGLFSIGEDLDDEDVLGTDWTACSASGPASGAAAVSSCALRAPGLCGGPALRGIADPQTAAVGLRRLSSSAQPHPPLNKSQPRLAPQQGHANAEGLPKPLDDFDDWDVDLADLDECDSQVGHLPKPAAARPPSAATAEPPSPGKTLRPSAGGGGQTPPNRTLRELSNACKAYGSSSRPAPPSAPPRSPGVFPGLVANSPPPISFSRTFNNPQQPQKPWATPRGSHQARSPFETVSPAPSPSVGSSISPHPMHTPVLTNRLVQLVSASSKLPKKRPRSEGQQPRTRRFPGPAGLLPQQPQGQDLDEIVVSAPQTPAHGAAARLPSQGSGSQSEEEEFGGGGWAAMKAEMGLDERNPSCFLHTHSVIMVLRKAALKQLSRNKVPNMAVLLKSIIHTQADAKAVFKDPTGEIQGTVHRQLLEDRVEELKVGAVLLLKQVGVFSPSHRNHYLNVTSNNLLRVYPPDGASPAPARPPPLLQSPCVPLREPSTAGGGPRGPGQPVSQMQLLFDEEEDEGGNEEGGPAEDPRAQTGAQDNQSLAPCRGLPEREGNPAERDADWEADDDLDELLGELPEDTYSL